ncbi:hypothetical protein [Halorhodospira halochloris]|uniref:hypothetical protein n=1 Tax=Halorhodospira halochloris TaxID=1052 RepID=UPI001EE7BCA7|nr:hypothetical protein [Halorhodospira halochloris]MCG5548495.1 hypothetical protein [Halorhodospira halochloris]
MPLSGFGGALRRGFGGHAAAPVCLHSAAGAQVVTGPTQTNVMDLWVALVG